MLWNAEIEIDKNTIHSVFQEDTIIDLQVQASTDKGAKKEEIARCVIEPLRQTSLNDYQECHIILNTHGAASSNDLSDEIVKEVVAFISNHEIKIVQMSALQCNGLKGQTAREYREANPFTPQHQQVNDKPSSMAILQAKLSSMHTQIQQSFPICGFMTAYDPKKDRNKVEELLLNGSSVSLTVATQQAPKEELQVVRQHIKICKKYAEKQAKGLNISSDFMSQYSQATNAFGRILHKMTQNIGNYLGGTQQLTAASIVLYETVTGSPAPTEPSQKPIPQEFTHQYKRWLKNNKMSSPARLKILEAYCELEATVEAQITKPAEKPCKVRDEQLPAFFLCYGKSAMFSLKNAKEPNESIEHQMIVERHAS